MAKLTLVLPNDPILRQLAAPIEVITPDIEELARDMIAMMQLSGGVGLAAPQVGYSVQLFVMKPPGQVPTVCINPTWRAMSSELDIQTEGCLSLPDTPVDVLRFKHITATWQRTDRSITTFELLGLHARIFQHENDHLVGKLITDYQVAAEPVAAATS